MKHKEAHQSEKTDEKKIPATPEQDVEDSEAAQDALFEAGEAAGNACDLGPEEPPAAGPEAQADAIKKELEEYKKKVEDITEQRDGFSDKYLRLMAEFDNFKRRSAKEYEHLVEAASERLMRDIIEVRENFERGFKSNDEGQKFIEGMKLIFNKLNTILHKHGLEMYGERGQEFNPEIHDALMRMPHEEIPEGHIIEVHERGYRLKGKIIRHARVVVSTGKPQETTEKPTSEN